MTVAIYQNREDGMLRLGTFTVPGRPNYRMVAAAFHRRYPNMYKAGPLFIAARHRLPGAVAGWADGERLPMDNPKEATR